MKVAFYDAVPTGAVSEPGYDLLIHISLAQALPRVDETVVVAGRTWVVIEVVHLVGAGDDYEARVWLR